MKKILVITMILLVAGMQLAAATSGVYVADNTGDDCDNTGCGDCGGIKLEGWDDDIEDDGTWGGITIDEEEGSKFKFTWNSGEQDICAIVVKAGSEQSEGGYFTYDIGGETSGTIDITGLTDRGISHVTFCFDCGGSGGGDPDNSIPEYPTIALPIAAIIGIAFLMQRRKE